MRSTTSAGPRSLSLLISRISTPTAEGRRLRRSGCTTLSSVTGVAGRPGSSLTLPMPSRRKRPRFFATFVLAG
eukprot:2393122-Prorocentrum_lima.AAC.1